MKKILNNRCLVSLFVMAGCCMMSVSCSDWTDTESLDLDGNKFEQTNPDKYAQYLEELRTYKQSNHKVLYAWMDNVQVPTSRAHHLTMLPDSVDVISLLNPDNLPQWTLDEMAQIRKDKGMKVVYTVSYTDLELSYKNYTDNLEEGTEAQSFLDFEAEYMDKAIALCDKYGYDGISFHYMGKGTNHMTEAVKADFLARQEGFMSKVATWVAANPGKMFIFEGTPHFLTDKTILSSASYIVLRTTGSNARDMLSVEVMTAMGNGSIPSDRFIVTVVPISLDPADASTGRFTDGYGNRVSAILEAATWVSTPETGFTKAGLGIYGIQTDYYNISLVYRYTRAGISIMNPTPKK